MIYEIKDFILLSILRQPKVTSGLKAVRINQQYQHHNREDVVMLHKPYSNAELALDNSRKRL